LGIAGIIERDGFDPLFLYESQFGFRYGELLELPDGSGSFAANALNALQLHRFRAKNFSG
jgi:hypothetical protein